MNLSNSILSDGIIEVLQMEKNHLIDKNNLSTIHIERNLKVEN